MKTVFVSNYINHHQIPFSDALYEQLGGDYHFIQTEPMSDQRVQMGWAVDAKKIPYVVFSYEEEQRCRQLIAEADLLLAGWTEHTELFTDRLGSGKLTLRISERIYREGQWKFLSPRGLLAKYREHIRYRKKEVYLLCAGAYVASDFALIGAYPNKMFQFGYFPQTRYYEKNRLWEKKPADGVIHMVWAGRMIPLKHPEYALQIAKQLQEAGYDFKLHMIGSGRLEEALKNEAQAAGLSEKVHFYGFQTPEQVRDRMERCHIHLFTSNYLEGWGTVVNEAMNSGCCVVANSQAGAVPYLITDGENGCVYGNGSYEAFAAQVMTLFAEPEKMERLGKAAYRTITEIWNEKQAARACLDFYENWKKGQIKPPDRGPFAKAPVLPAHFSYREGHLE